MVSALRRLQQGKPVERLGEDFPEEVAFGQEPERNEENLPSTLVVQSFRQREQQLQRS